MRFYIKRPPTKNNPKTYLAADAASGSTTLTVKNTAGFSNNDFIILGNPGFENTEIKRISSITAPSTFTLSSATSFPHNADTPVTLINYDQIKIYRSTTGIDGTYNLLATIDIDIDNDVTYFEDPDAQTNYYYKFKFYNSYTTKESDFSDPIAGTGFVFYSKKTLIDRTLSLFGDTKEEFVTSDEVSDFLNEFLGIAKTELSVATKRFDLKKQDITLSNETEYNLNPDFLVEAAVKISTDGGKTFPYSAAEQKIDSIGTVVQNNIRYGYTIYNDGITNKIILDREPTSGDIMRIWYIPTPPTLSNQTDTLPSPFINHTSMFVTYALAKCYLKDKKFDEYKTLRDDAFSTLRTFLSYIKRLSNRHVQFSELVDLEPVM